MAAQRHTSQRITLVILVLVSITIVTLDYHGEASRGIGNVQHKTASVLAPIQRLIAAVLHPVGDAFSGALHYGQLQTENARLQSELGATQRQLATQSYALSAVREIGVLQRLPFVDVPSVAAEVISAPTSNFEHTVELDEGTSSGVGPGMPVVADQGLVGSVVSASTSTCEVLLLDDPRATYAVQVGGGLYEASGSGRGSLGLTLLPPGTAVPAVRDLVYTSGQDNGAQPPAIPVGVVETVSLSPGGGFSSATVRPLVNLDDLTYVSVLQWLPPA